MLMTVSTRVSKRFKKKVLRRLLHDKIANAARNDRMIVKYGVKYFNKNKDLAKVSDLLFFLHN